MKKYSILFILFQLMIFNLSAQILPIKSVIQKNTNWCWAASSKCVLDYYNYPLEQCEIAEYTRKVTTWHNFGCSNCCSNPSDSCNYANISSGSAGSIQDILVHFGNIVNVGKARSLSTTEIQTEITNFRPFILRWTWSYGGGHFMVGYGLNNGTLYYMNPWFGEGLCFGSYDWVESNPDHTWANTNLLTTNPQILTTSVDTLTISAQASSLNSFNITSNITWTASSDQSWLTLSSPGGSGSSTITLAATANPTETTRTSTVTISGTSLSGNKTITVIQNGQSTAIDETLSNSILTFPNPTTDYLTISGLSVNSLISIYDLKGNLLINEITKSTTMKIDLTSLSEGIYLVKVIDNNASVIRKINKINN